MAAAAAMQACCNSSPKGGGACDYEHYEGYCKLERIQTEVDDGGTASVYVTYRNETGEGHGEGRESFRVPAASASAVKAHYDENPRVKCKGSTRTRGSCSPGPLTLDMPKYSPE